MELYWPKVRSGGLLAGHDYNEKNPDRVMAAVKKFCNKYKVKYEWAMNKGEKVADWWCWKK